jgi:hypothetical protein
MANGVWQREQQRDERADQRAAFAEHQHQLAHAAAHDLGERRALPTLELRESLDAPQLLREEALPDQPLGGIQ